MSADSDGAQPTGRNGFPVLVVIGASAGGMRPLQELFATLPDATGAAFVVVVHLDPEHRSDLPHILAARTNMPVTQVHERETLEPNHIYVIPPDRRLQIVDHHIETAPFEEPRGQRLPIDSLFRSAAEHVGDGFAVVMSGAGSDGTLGIRAVKEAGGIILVQDPSEAEYGSMPRNAIGTGVVDFVLPVAEIAARLVDLIGLKRASNGFSEAEEVDEDLLRRILAHLRVRTGHDFSKYKRSTVLRRIARRMQVTRAESLKQYYDVLRDRAEEAQSLLSDLLISVTTFFRDPESFELLQRTVIPNLFNERDAGDTVRVWVSGCATGEEAFSIAMLLLEEAAKHEMRPSIQVFGSDLDVKALAVAREGRYPASIDADVSEERLRRFFIKEGDAYRVRQEVRDCVLFAVHDLLKDPPFSHVSLISCRNVLIYLDRELQEQVCATFHYALNPGGFMLLGSSETADNPAGLFRVLDRNARLYQSTAVTGERPRPLPNLIGPVHLRGEHVVQINRGLSPSAALSEAAIHRRAIEKVAPPSMLVDETHRVLHMSDNAGRFVQPSGGALSGDIVDLVRPELRFELRSALNRLFEQNHPSLSLPIPVRFDASPHRVHLLVRAADDGDAGHPNHAIVMFVEGEDFAEQLEGGDQHATSETVRRLTQELELTQSRLRTVREESDAANEELRAANEELQSINEEYRSTSEELETSKEELQSINEELQTVNSELKHKLETISRAHSDLQNLMAATDFGTLFLDSNLKIKRFTERVTQLFSITLADEGRPITDFAHQLDYPDLMSDARHLLANLAPVQREVKSHNGLWFDVRMRPYRTVDNKIDGVVITFVDITERRRVEQALRDSEELFRSFAEASTDVMWIRDAETLQWEYLSPAFEAIYGLGRDKALSGDNFSSWTDLILPEDLDGALASIERLRKGEQATFEYRITRPADGQVRWLRDTDFPMVDASGTVRRIGGIGSDVTEEKQSSERMDVMVGELQHRTRNLIGVVQSVATQTMDRSPDLQAFRQSFGERLQALSRVQGLLSRFNTEQITIGRLVDLELQAMGHTDRIRTSGPEVPLPKDVVQTLALALHELATNARKYGALATDNGQLHIQWQLQRQNSGHRVLVINWREDGTTRTSGEAPEGSGYGRVLIEKALPYSLGANTSYELGNGKLRCTIELPLDPPQDQS